MSSLTSHKADSTVPACNLGPVGSQVFAGNARDRRTSVMTQGSRPRSQNPGGVSRTESSTAAPGRRNTSFLMPVTSIRRLDVGGVGLFYREAGPPDGPVVLLLHGFPASSFMFRELIPRLADRYRVIAPDLPGFGFTEVPSRRNYAYSFDTLARTIEAFTEALDLAHYALYVFDYGAPTGFRLAMAHPERVAAIVARPGNMDIQLDLLLDYASNVRLYPAFQRYFRERQPPFLAIWGKNDPFFIPAGAEAFRNDIRNAQVEFLDTGHFATETHVVEIAAAMREFLDANGGIALASKGEGDGLGMAAGAAFDQVGGAVPRR